MAARNAVARSLTLRRTHTLGIVIPDLMHSFFVEIIAGVEPVASERGYGLLLCSSGENSAKERSELQLPNSVRVPSRGRSDIVGIELPGEAEKHDLTLLVRESVDHRPQLIPLFSCYHAGLRSIRLDRENRVHELVSDDLPPTHAVSIDHEVLRYPEYPGLESASSPSEPVQSSKHFRERLRCDVLGVLLAAQSSERVPVQTRVEMVEQGRGVVLIAPGRSSYRSIYVLDVHSVLLTAMSGVRYG